MPQHQDLVVAGLGSAGILAVELARSLGLRVAGVEAHRVGGDCLWTGCVPSKALISSAQVAHLMRHADRFGLTPAAPPADPTAVWRRIHAIREEIAQSDDSADRLREEGIEVVEGAAASLGAPHEVRVAGRPALRSRFVLLCTGSRPAVPPIPGLVDAGFLTPETLWDRERGPASVVIIGGGPAGTELGQALARLGSRVTLLERDERLLPRAEPAHAATLAQVLTREGVEVRTGVRIAAVRVERGEKVVAGRDADGAGREWPAQEVLVTAGRSPNIEGLGLAAHGIRVSRRGIVADEAGRTAAPWVYAAGDVAGRECHTHAAAAQAARALRTMFFPGAARGPLLVPSCTFTDPELAQVGRTEAEARAVHGHRAVRVWERELARIDRARTASRTTGSIRIVTARGRVVGASVLAPAASELIGELTIAVERRWRLARLASTVHVYPTIATGVQQLAGEAAIAAARPFLPLARLGSRVTGR